MISENNLKQQLKDICKAIDSLLAKPSLSYIEKNFLCIYIADLNSFLEDLEDDLCLTVDYPLEVDLALIFRQCIDLHIQYPDQYPKLYNKFRFDYLNDGIDEKFILYKRK